MGGSESNCIVTPKPRGKTLVGTVDSFNLRTSLKKMPCLKKFRERKNDFLIPTTEIELKVEVTTRRGKICIVPGESSTLEMS